jgi:hypothetical protein
MTNCDIYDLGVVPHCGLVKLPFPANGIGEYYLKVSTGNVDFNLPTALVTNENPFFWIDASSLPMHRDLKLSIYSAIGNEKQTFNLTRNIGSDCDVENEEKCFSKFNIFLKYTTGIESYAIEFPETGGGGTSELLYYDIRFVTGNTFVSTYNLPDFSLYTTVSVNASLRVYVDGIKYYYNENIQDFSDQIVVNGNVISFLEAVNGGRVEVEFYNNLVLK